MIPRLSTLALVCEQEERGLPTRVGRHLVGPISSIKKLSFFSIYLEGYYMLGR